MKEEAEPLAKIAKQAIEAEDLLCEQIRSVINTAFGSKVTVGVDVKLRSNHVSFQVTGCWNLPKDS
jgi:hypothetical protein